VKRYYPVFITCTYVIYFYCIIIIATSRCFAAQKAPTKDHSFWLYIKTKDYVIAEISRREK
jgi:hypothetical protein